MGQYIILHHTFCICNASSFFCYVFYTHLRLFGDNLLPHLYILRVFFAPKLQYFLSFKLYLNITQAKQIINLLFLGNFYPMISFRRVEKESHELLVWSLVMVRETVTSAAGS